MQSGVVRWLSSGYKGNTLRSCVWAVIVHWDQQGVSLPLLNWSPTLQCGRSLPGPEVCQRSSFCAHLCRRLSLFPYRSNTMHGPNSYTLSLHLAFLRETEEQTSHTDVTLLRLDIAAAHVVQMTVFYMNANHTTPSENHFSCTINTRTYNQHTPL